MLAKYESPCVLVTILKLVRVSNLVQVAVFLSLLVPCYTMASRLFHAPLRAPELSNTVSSYQSTVTQLA